MHNRTTHFEVLGHSTYTNESISEEDIRILSKDGDVFRLSLDGVVYEALVKHFDPQMKTCVLNISGFDFTVKINEPLDQMIQKLGFLQSVKQSVKEIKSPMPGLVVSIFVEVGQSVSEGEKLLSLEAMKMENILKSPGTGIIQTIKVNQGDSVEKNQILVTFE